MIGRSVPDAEIIATFGPSEEGTILAPNHYNKGVADYMQHYELFHDMCPSPFSGIKAVLSHFNEISKEEIIYMGDAASDITASRSAGVPVVAAAWAETAEPEKLKALEPDELFYSIDNFTSWLYNRI